MTKILPIILSLTIVCAESTSAQIVPWYLKGKKKKAEKVQVQPVEPAKDSSLTVTRDSTAIIIAPDSSETGRPDSTEAVVDGSADIMLVMPFRQDSVSNTTVLDFYCGALLAARDFGETGKRIKLSAFDCSNGIDSSYTGSAKTIIGPFGREGIKELISAGSGRSAVVSALDSEPFADSTAKILVQIPTSAKYRHSALAEWFSSRVMEGRKLIVLADDKVPSDAFTSDILKSLSNEGVRYLKTQDTTMIARNFTEADTLAVLIASESEHYVKESIRAISALSMRRYNIETFCSAKVRTYGTMDVDFLHNCNVHLCTNYHIDYNRPEVQAFVRTYRAVFNCEPEQFAFHGYDVVKYISELMSEYGRNWTGMLDRNNAAGLQTDFKFIPDGADGRTVNTAVIKLEYCKDYSVRTH